MENAGLNPRSGHRRRCRARAAGGYRHKKGRRFGRAREPSILSRGLGETATRQNDRQVSSAIERARLGHCLTGGPFNAAFAHSLGFRNLRALLRRGSAVLLIFHI